MKRFIKGIKDNLDLIIAVALTSAIALILLLWLVPIMVKAGMYAGIGIGEMLTKEEK